MSSKTTELRDIFVGVTQTDTVTEKQQSAEPKRVGEDDDLDLKRAADDGLVDALDGNDDDLAAQFD